MGPGSSPQPRKVISQVATSVQAQHPSMTVSCSASVQSGAGQRQNSTDSVSQPWGTHAATQSRQPEQLEVPQGLHQVSKPQSALELHVDSPQGAQVAGFTQE